MHDINAEDVSTYRFPWSPSYFMQHCLTLRNQGKWGNFFYFLYVSIHVDTNMDSCVSSHAFPIHMWFRYNHIFYICKPYLFLQIYDLLNIPHLAVIFFTAMTFLLQFINILHLADISVLSHLGHLIYSLFGRHIYFSLFMPVPF